METLIEFGYDYFIKDGKVAQRKLHTNKTELIRIANSLSYSCTIPILALEEQKHLNAMTSQDDYFKIYKDFLESNYTVIRIAYSFYFKFNDNKQIEKIQFYDKGIYAYVPIEMSKESYNKIMKIFNKEVQNTNSRNLYIYNVISHNSELDYDYLSSVQINRNYHISESLDVLLREKINCLTEEEKVMLNEYRDYDLKSILTVNYLDKKISHGNAGSIVITPNSTQERTIKKHQHGSEIRWSLYKEGLIDFDNDDCIWDLSEKTNSIIIQLCLGEAILWLNPLEKRTPYQQVELERILNSIYAIRDDGYRVDISAAICENHNFKQIKDDEILCSEQNSDNQKRTV